jgi:D-psicose/D-tagatose/L-ribulose 3-epimerase
MFKYSATQWIFGNEDLEISLKRLKKYGYDAAEIIGEPYTVDIDHTKKLLDQNGLYCSSICGIYTKERDLGNPDPSIRATAIKYIKDSVDMAVALDAPHVIVVPNAVGKTAPSPGFTYEQEWEWSVASVREAAQYAASKNINLAMESINRFESYLIINHEQALDYVKQVNVGSCKIMADTFHMNIEERENVQALKLVADYLIHVHAADNTREAPGMGQFDFETLLRTLKEINYNGPITMEFLPRVADTYTAILKEGNTATFDHFAETAIREMKRIEQKLQS